MPKYWVKNYIWGPYYVMIDTVSFLQNIQNFEELCVLYVADNVGNWRYKDNTVGATWGYLTLRKLSV